MSSSSRSRTTASSATDSDSHFSSTVKRIYRDYEHREIPKEKIALLSERLTQIWTSLPSRLAQSEGYRVIDYLERLIVDQKIHDPFFILVVSTLAKNNHFFQSLLADQQRFQPLLTSKIGKAIYLMRYLELLYFYCPSPLLATTGLQFYRFVVDTHLLAYLRRSPRDIDWLSAFSTLLFHFSENNTSKSNECLFSHVQDAIDYSTAVVDTLLHHRLKVKSVKDLLYDVKLINTIVKVLGVVWEQSPSSDDAPSKNPAGITSIQLRSIEYLFTAMSHHQLTFSSAILPLFSRIQLEAAEMTVKTMSSDGRLTGDDLSILIKCLIELLDAPTQLMQTMQFETWVTGLCTALITFNQHECLSRVIDETSSFLIDHLLAENALLILFWFVRYDRRAKTFLLLVDRLPEFFHRLQAQQNEELQTKLIELCHMAMGIHRDFDLSQHPALKEILQSFPHPDLNVLSNHQHIHARLHSIVPENEPSSRTRVGIVNLGNTCYVNSVLQALYQCDLFRKYILEHRCNEQQVLRELQLVFAQLNLSKRPFINAANLVKVARPAWFTSNEQQDCAEFLGYLLDTIKDEEKKDQSISSYEIERLFTIRTSQINRCQRCSRESSREESSNYLFLPIPTGDRPSDMMNYNQSARLNASLENGLKFYAASNTNSTSEDQARGVAASLVSSSTIQAQSSPPSYNSLQRPTTADSSTHLSPGEKPSLNLQRVFDCYFQKEELKDDNQYRCEHCRSLQDAERSTILQTAPEYLILSLNRFDYDKRTNIFRKVFTKMNYPKVLNVHVHPSQHARHRPVLTKYCLVLVIVHTGYTLHGGHYYVYAREVKPLLTPVNPDDADDYFSNDEWFLLNDDLVVLSSYEALIENCAQYTSATPYVLIYKRVDQQRIEAMKQASPLRVHDSLIEQIDEDNRIYRREQEKLTE